MADVLNLAFLGCGWISNAHLRGIESLDGKVRVTAAIDIDGSNAERIAESTGATVFSSLTYAIEAGGFDAVDIMLPHHLHESAAIECFKAGKDVLLEKPMAPTLDACERIMAAAKESGVVFMVGENAEYWPEVVKANELIADGAIGELVTVHGSSSGDMAEGWAHVDDVWRFDAARTGGGIVIDGGSHWLRPIRMWMGEIVEVAGALGHPIERMEGETVSRVLLRFESGRVGGLDMMMLDAVFAPHYVFRITGMEGEIVIGEKPASIHLYNKANPEGQRVLDPCGYDSSFAPEIDDFAGAVLKGKALKADAERSLGELRAALAIYRSAKSGKWEKV
jgi:predicted dehydrogenase